MIPQEIEDRNDVLFKKLVPDSGKCETLEGEVLRATNRLCYRWYNDGDYWYQGYGCETAGPAVGFLFRYSPMAIREKVTGILLKSDGLRKAQYETCLVNLVTTVVEYLEGCGTQTPNNFDMLEIDAPYKRSYDDDGYGYGYDEDEDEDEEY